ncbi:serine/threonine-protein kinase [Nocardia huaxiensis]|uniref:serine/threonine-protein kinase n=1 Tax=Nocardia huaxiensis TaxID=2755382 RepID=UPI001E4E8569|nr:serine/threonine-protein kinase [Nocardia huaxiensis]UFS96129.1 protein kinase [Nocardia huaxiensis]
MSVSDLKSTDIERVRAALPGYEVGGQIGRGGCGVVLAGVHRGLNRRVAIKQIPPQFAGDMAVRRRFVAEARMMAALDHPHVVPVYDYIEHDDMCLLVLEFLPGGTVEQRFVTAGFEATAAVAVALSCAAGLDVAHRQGILHRDVKPSNLMFSGNGTLKLTDFGIAKIVGGDETLVTRAGEILGTPSYIAPEQVRGQQLSPATDVYALATMLYQLLSGTLPFPPAEDTLAMLFAHAYGEPVPLDTVAPTIPQPIADVVMRGLAPDPDSRFDSAESFGVALAEPAAFCWGTGWLTPVGIPVVGADTIVAAATGSRTPARPSPPPSPHPRAPSPTPTATPASPRCPAAPSPHKTTAAQAVTRTTEPRCRAAKRIPPRPADRSQAVRAGLPPRRPQSAGPRPAAVLRLPPSPVPGRKTLRRSIPHREVLAAGRIMLCPARATARRRVRCRSNGPGGRRTRRRRRDPDRLPPPADIRRPTRKPVGRSGPCARVMPDRPRPWRSRAAVRVRRRRIGSPRRVHRAAQASVRVAGRRGRWCECGRWNPFSGREFGSSMSSGAIWFPFSRW